ncbi:uncharacterized protein LOC142163786 [Nicotiana tabacum]|uniref:Uncharacterized protein LOC142163786 n=1 Tax=Nicotiana tabacum TaxID=4097 RepID=A0AC58RWC8_TOBAC
MATDDNSGDSTNATPIQPILDHNHPLYLYLSDGPGSLSIGLLLTGIENYALWSRAMKVALLGKNKLCLVDGTTSKGDFGSGLAHQWDRCNAIVTSWLMSNVNSHLLTGVLFSENTQTVWARLKERFDKVNASRLYYFHKEFFTSTLGISSVSIYFTKLTDLWAEYDAILPPPPVKDYVEQLEFQRLLQFLMGLNDSFEQARSQILMMPNVPSINQAYTMIVQDESKRTISSNQFNTHIGQVEPTAMFTSQSGNRPRRNFGIECEFSHQKGHTKASCYKLMKCELLNKSSIAESSGNIAAVAENAGQVQLPTGDSAVITHIEDCQLSGGDTIKNVLCVPAFKFNLLSVSKDLWSGRVKEIGREEDGMYTMISVESHKRMHSHKAFTVLKQEIQIYGIRERGICEIFPLARQTRMPFPANATRMDHYTRWTWTFLLRLKSDVVFILKNFLAMVKTQFGNSVKMFRQPSLSHLRIIGCLCFASLLPKTDKFGPRAMKFVLLGYAALQKGYKLLDLEHNNLKEGTGQSFLDELNMRTLYDYNTEIMSVIHILHQLLLQIHPLFLLQRVPHCIYPIAVVIGYDQLSPKYQSYLSQFSSEQEPNSYYEVAKDNRWIEAMQAEIKALEDNKTREIVPLPPGKRAKGYKWVYKIKYKATGRVGRFKARLVAKRYSQKEGLDYQKTFSPVLKMVTVRSVIALAASTHWTIHQMDVYNAFLQGDLTEEVFMCIPPGFVGCNNRSLVCKLNKSLYGLKQASRQWNIKLTTSLLASGFQQSHLDYSFFTKKSLGQLVVVLVYVDDLIITGDDLELI